MFNNIGRKNIMYTLTQRRQRNKNKIINKKKILYFKIILVH